MQSASRESLALLRRDIEPMIVGRADSSALAGDLYGFANLLEGQARLRRLLSDPAAPIDQRKGTATALLGGKVGSGALELIGSAVGSRWSSPFDLVDSLVELGNQAVFAGAESTGSLAAMEDELFRFGRILEAESSVTTLLDDQSIDLPRRSALLRSLVGGKVQPLTMQLLEQALAQRGRGFALRVEALADAAAARQSRSVARVRSAVPLSPEQERRLAQALTATYGRPIGVRTEVDPAVRGGLVIRVGDELIDGSVAKRLASARAALAGT